MTLEDFKDVYKDAPLLTKLNLLMEVQSRRADAQAIAATERWNENAEAERHWVNEHRSASAKATWLFEELKKALKAQEPCEDAVSKQTVISALEGEYSDWNDDYNIPITHCIKAVQSLPSVSSAPMAKVMNATEVSACEVGTVLWVEERQGVTWNLFPLEIETSSTHPDTGTDYLFFVTYHGIGKFECSEYNQTWRCWTSRPTDEQREATPWP